MKKITYILVLFIISITLVNAKNCTVISGTGKNIGDEIACGSEHFYVVSNDGTNVKMLGKYNLLRGTTYEYIPYEVETTKDPGSYRYLFYADKMIQDKINQYGYDIENVIYEYNSINKTYKITGLRLLKYDGEEYKIITFDEEKATFKESVLDTQIIEHLNNGWEISDSLANDNGLYYGMKLVKKSYIDSSKIILLDGTQRTLGDMIKIPEVKELLDLGYYIKREYDTNDSYLGDEKIYDYYAIFMQRETPPETETINIIFDTKIRGTQNFDNYIKNNQFIQEKLAEGYRLGNKREFAEYYPSEYNYYGIRLYKYNYQEEIYQQTFQSEKAIGINGDVNNPNYPFYGTVFHDENLSDLLWEENFGGTSYGGGYYQDFYISSHDYLVDYKRTLEDMDYIIGDVSTLSIKELNEMTKAITGIEIPLEEWYENKMLKGENTWDDGYYVLGNLKSIYTEEYHEKYNWIWGTSYWLKTIDPNHDIYDINTMGDLCLTDVCNSTPSRGVRPLVTIAVTNIDYKIATKTDGNGTVQTTHTEAQNGEQIKFTIEPERGYKLKEIKVTDYEGNVIIFTENTFTMPNSNVLIEATFEIKNPNTISISIIAALMFSILSIIIVKVNYKKMKWLNE